MQLITTRNKEISFVELKKAISSGNGLELIRPGDKFAIELKNGEHVNAVCGGYVNEKRARFVLEDCLADKWRMNDTPTNKGGYLKSEGRRHVLEDNLETVCRTCHALIHEGTPPLADGLAFDADGNIITAPHTPRGAPK